MSRPLTVRDLYKLACMLKMEDATIRICDGMAVHMFVTRDCVCTSPMEFVIDVSCLDAVDFEDLSDVAKRIDHSTALYFSSVDNF